MFFYKKRGLQAPEPEPVGLKSYMLVRVAMDVGEEEWFGEKLRLPEETAWGEEPETAAVPKPAPETRFCPGKKRIPFGGLLRAIWPRRDRGREGGPKPNAAEAGEGQPEPLERTGGRLRKNRRKQAVREQAENREALLAGQAERIRITEAAVRKLALQAAELAGEGNTCYCVYENSVRKALTGEKKNGQETAAVLRNAGTGGSGPILPVIWRRYFEQREFADYGGRFWVEQLMPEAALPHFVILGTAACVPELIERYAGRMKSLKWILPEADCTEEVQEFVENFYIDSGLAVSLQTIPSAGEFRRLRQICVLPSNIIDFTDESGMGTCGAAGGSIWLDMRSVEEKKRRIQGHGAEVTYISMKEKWKYVQRRCKSPVLP